MNTMPYITINIAQEFAYTPGAREVDEGAFSGEDFLKNKLIPKFDLARSKNMQLLVELDNVEGYATSFLEEAFGGLARKYGEKIVLQTLRFTCLDEPLLEEEILLYISEANALA